MANELQLTLTKISDSPMKRTVEAVLSDGSVMLLESMSGDNYTLPPGYMDPDTSKKQDFYRALFAERYNNYIKALAAQAIKDGVNLAGKNMT